MQASIDIGTNTVLLLVAEVIDGTLDIVEEVLRAPRLGKGVDKSGNLSPAAIKRVVKALTEYKRKIDKEYPGVEGITVTATSAVRDAANRSEFLEEVQRKTGLSVHVLSGQQEARLTYAGAKSVLPAHLISTQNVVLDIGGGSTEIAIGANNTILDQHSYNMGCVRFTERYLASDPLVHGEVNNCEEAIDTILQKHPLKVAKKATLIGVAGTVTSLAYIDLDLREYKGTKINGYAISLHKLQDYIKQFAQISSVELIDRYPVVMRDRADIFRAGLLILERVMQRYGFSEFVVSTGGIRHGAILEIAKK